MSSVPACIILHADFHKHTAEVNDEKNTFQARSNHCDNVLQIFCIDVSFDQSK